MASYSVFLKASAAKELSSIPRKELQRLVARIALLADDPRPPGCEKLSGQERYRIRQGHYRVIYSIHETELTIWIVTAGHRREVYR